MQWMPMLLNYTGLFLQVGAHIYAKATFIIFIIVFTVLVSIFICFFTVGPPVLILPETSLANNTSRRTANYTGLWLCTLKGNLFCKCQTSLQTYFDRCCVHLTHLVFMKKQSLTSFYPLKLITRLTTPLVAWWVLPEYLQSCSTAAVESWQAPACQVL